MSLLTLEGVAKDGQIQVDTTMDLPGNAKAYVSFAKICLTGLTRCADLSPLFYS